MLRFIAAILAGIAGAAVGFAAGWAVGAALAEILEVSCFEGLCGYYVGMWALLGAGIGLIAGIVIALVWKRRRPVPPPLPGQASEVPAAAAPEAPAGGGAQAGATTADPRPDTISTTLAKLVGAIAVIAALVVGGVWLYIQVNDDTLAGSNQATPRLEYEIRFPAGTVLPEHSSAVDVRLDTEKNQAWGYLPDDWRQTDGERPVVNGLFDLYYRASSRVLSIKLPEGPTYVFVLKLPRSPGHMAEFSEWHPVDYVDDGTTDNPHKPTGTEAVDIRYRVVYAGRD